MPIALYHCTIKIISRTSGRSAVAAAYRSGTKITNEGDGEIHDYTRKGGVIYTEILLPDHAPTEYADRSISWNAAQKIEKTKTSQLAREIEIALPIELTREQTLSLAREYVKKYFAAEGMCADLCLHDKNDGNPHAHIMLTMRHFEQGGKWGKKQKKEYILDEDGNKIYDPIKRQYECNSIPLTDWNEHSKAEQILFTAATTYLKGVMNGYTALPVKAWKAEYATLTAEHKTLNGRHLKLKDEVSEAEKIRKSVYKIL